MKRAADLHGFNSLQVINEKTPQTDPITILPMELIDYIFSNLRDSEIPCVRLVCKFWMDRTVSIALQNISEIKNFVNFLNANLKINNESQKTAFSKLHESAKPLVAIKNEEFHFGKFIQGRGPLKENFFKILMNLSLDDITRLREVSKEKVPLNCFEHIFDLAQIYKRIEIMDKMPRDDSKSATIKRIGIDLAVVLGSSENNKHAGVHTIEYSLLGLRPILRKGFSREDIILAIIYILYTAKFEDRSSLCKDIAKVLAFHDELDTALQILLYIHNLKDRDWAHAKLSKILVQVNSSDALKVADKIENCTLKASTKEMIFATTQEPYKITGSGIL